MFTADRLLRKIEELQAESSSGGVKAISHDVPIEVWFGILHGKDQAFELVREVVQDMLSEEDDKEEDD